MPSAKPSKTPRFHVLCLCSNNDTSSTDICGILQENLQSREEDLRIRELAMTLREDQAKRAPSVDVAHHERGMGMDKEAQEKVLELAQRSRAEAEASEQARAAAEAARGAAESKYRAMLHSQVSREFSFLISVLCQRNSDVTPMVFIAQKELIHREEELKLRETALKFREEEAEASIRAAAEFRRALAEERTQIDGARAKDSGRKAFELAELNRAETARAAAESQYLSFRNAQVPPLPPRPPKPPQPPLSR